MMEVEYQSWLTSLNNRTGENSTYLTRVVTWVRNSEIDSSVAKSVDEEAGGAFDEALLTTFKKKKERESP